MDINNNQQTNTFTKGMNTDTADMYIPSDQYRYAENLRYVTDVDNNTGELSTICGSKKIYLTELPTVFIYVYKEDIYSTDQHFITIKFVGERDYDIKLNCIIMWKNGSMSTSHYTVPSDQDILRTDLSTSWHLVESYNVTLDEDTSKKDIRIIYGQQSMSQSVEFSSIFKTDTIRNYGILIGTVKGEDGWSIYRYDYTNDRVKRIFGPCTDQIGNDVSTVCRWESDNNIKLYIADGINELISLNIDDKHTIYLYNTIKDLTGYSNVPLPEVLVENSLVYGNLKGPVVQYAYVLYKTGNRQTDVSPLSKPYSIYKNDYQGYYNTNSDKSLELSINLRAINHLDSIKIYRIEYVYNGQIPTINIIYDGKFEEDFKYVDSGRNIEEVSLSDFISQTNLYIKPLLIESKNDYLFAANIEYKQEDVDEQFKNVDDSYFKIETTFTQYNVTVNGKFVTDEDMYNYGRSFKIGETYRFGVILYDNDGRKSSVKWIGDKKIEPKSNSNIDYVTINEDGTYRLKKYGVRVSVTKDIPNCSGYEIVRCNRTINDSSELFQGILSIPADITSDEDSELRWIEHAFPYYSCEKTTASSNNHFVFSCPEYVYQKDDVEQILNDKAGSLTLNHIAQYRTVQHSDDSLFDTIYPGTTENSIRMHAETTVYVKPVNPPEENGIKISDFIFHSAYLYPERIKDSTTSKTVDIENIYFVDSPAYDSFSNGDTVTLLDQMVPVDGNQFLNWYLSHPSIAQPSNSLMDSMKSKTNAITYTASTGGRCMVIGANTEDFKLNASVSVIGMGSTEFTDTVPITIAGIYNKGVVPYGGDTEFSKKYSVYYSFGDYFKYTELNSLGVDVYSGDVYTYVFIYNAFHTFHSDRYLIRRANTVYLFPIQSSIDLRATAGSLYPYMTDERKFLCQDEPVTLMGYTQNKPAYLYNTVYNTIPNVISYTFVEKTDIDTNKYDTRIHYSGPKTNGESTDSWVKFKAADFLDVDTRFGELTHMRLFKDALMYWQRNATGVLSVNERTVLQDVNDTNIILGTGDVLQRYDYITTEYGMKPAHHSETQSNTTLYWWDGYKREIVGYSGGQTVQPLNKVKTVSNYINENGDIDKPAFEYDYKYNEVLMNVVDRGTLVYNEFTQAFTSIYTIDFDHSMRFSDELILEANNTFYVWNQGNYDLKPQLWYVVNNNPQMVKTYDNCVFGLGEKWHTYTGGSTVTVDNEWRHKPDDKLNALKFQFFTKGQNSSIDGTKKDSFITSREYDYRFAIPRYDDAEYGNRMRGKVMRVWMSLLDDNSYYKDFSIQYITTKYRISLS